ncbi:hypothetical protein TWF694_006412 [Orbilia ellipsospora]|uniref:F-box domain-containing protein n=1 Tax=Orbilia ellipsospora TaxID=2528407 RepID=A0AAV9XKF0_9PEZI
MHFQTNNHHFYHRTSISIPLDPNHIYPCEPPSRAANNINNKNNATTIMAGSINVERDSSGSGSRSIYIRSSTPPRPQQPQLQQRPPLPLPAELSLMILSFTPLEDLKSFSLCSKSCRALCLPVLFRGIGVSHVSIAAFEDGGSLCHLRSSVRYINLTVPKDTPFSHLVYKYKKYTHFLRLFPHLSALRLALYTSRATQYLLFLAIFSTISTYPFYTNLKALYLECLVDLEDLEEDDEDGTTSGEYNVDDYVLFRKCGEWEFLSSPAVLNGFDEGNDTATATTVDCEAFARRLRKCGVNMEKGIQYPPSLEEIYFTTPLAFRFRRGSKDYKPGFPEMLVLNCCTNSTSTAYSNSKINGEYGGGKRGTLKRLEIFAACLYTPRFSPSRLQTYLDHHHQKSTSIPTDVIIYPHVTRLRFDVAGFQNRNLREIRIRFPNLEELFIAVWEEGSDESVMPQYESGKVVYKAIVEMKRLKRIGLPWPVRAESGKVTVKHLERSVEWWKERGAVVGSMAGLEMVEFVRKVKDKKEEFAGCKIRRRRGGTDGEGWDYNWDVGKRPLPRFKDAPTLWALEAFEGWQDDMGANSEDEDEEENNTNGQENGSNGSNGRLVSSNVVTEGGDSEYESDYDIWAEDDTEHMNE